VQEHDFRVSLRSNIAFDYPGDGSGFYPGRSHSVQPEGLNLVAANNDYPIQQVAIIGGLAALSDVALER
jgi:hypothetical protein